MNRFFISDELCEIFYIDKNGPYDLEIINHVVYKDDKKRVAVLFQDAISLGISPVSEFKKEIIFSILR